MTASTTTGTELITLGGGCFWCTEAVYEQVSGVLAVESGYCNGHVKNPSYEQVCTGGTGHNEVVRVRFDPGQISLREVLEIFFVVHDPTTLNRQGNDAGTQYRSGIYWHEPAQEAVAREVLAEVQALHGGRVVTELLPLENYSRAEDYHQHYFANHPGQGYCAFVVAPKVEKFRKTFALRVKAAAG
jgi:peptide-methionine (S)-S-oxide reductase